MTKKLSTSQKNQIILTRNQIKTLSKMVEHFHEIDRFILEISNESEINSSISIRFNLFKSKDTKINTIDIRN